MDSLLMPCFAPSTLSLEGKHQKYKETLAYPTESEEAEEGDTTLVRFPNSLGCELGERRSYSL